jgi:hypothetical protein
VPLSSLSHFLKGEKKMPNKSEIIEPHPPQLLKSLDKATTSIEEVALEECNYPLI